MTDTVIRPKRLCEGCGIYDDHPRHEFTSLPGTEFEPVSPAILRAAAKVLPDDAAGNFAMAKLLDNTDRSLHMDCCRAAGCLDGSCDRIAAEGAEKLRGSSLQSFLTSGKVDHIGPELNAERVAAAEAARTEQEA